MARTQKTQFVCQECGTSSSRWAGRCANCGEWNTLIEEAQVGAEPGTGLQAGQKGKPAEVHTLQVKTRKTPRLTTDCEELDRVMGGGIVPGSAILIGGEPGIGKSTLAFASGKQSRKSWPHRSLLHR